MEKHTQGPWTYEEDGLPSRGRNHTVYAHTVDQHGFHKIELATNIYEEADARLMASAPRMKAVLKEVSVGLEFYMEKHGDRNRKLAELRGMVADELAAHE